MPRPVRAGPAGADGSDGSASRASTIVKRVMPGRLVTRTAPWWAATTASTMASPSPVDEALVACERDVSARVNRSNRSGSRSAGMPGPLSVTVSTTRGPGGSGAARGRLGAGARLAGGQRVADPDGDRGAVRGVPSGVAQQVGEDLVQPVLVAAGEHRVVGELEDPAVAGAGDPGVARRLDGQPGHVDRLAAQRAAGVKPGEQQQVVDEDAHPGGLRQHPAERVRDLVGGVAGVAQRELGVAADGGERGAQLVAGVGGEPAQPGLAGRPLAAARSRTWPSMRLNASPTWPVSVSGSVSGTPAGSDTTPDSSGSSATWDGGGGDPAQRAEREPDPEHAEHAGERQDGAEDHGLGERDVAQLVVLGGQRQAGDVDGAVAVGVVDRGEQVRALRAAEVAVVGGGVGAGACRCRRRPGVPRGDAAQAGLVGGGQLERVVADERALPLAVVVDGDEGVLAEPGQSRRWPR